MLRRKRSASGPNANLPRTAVDLPTTRQSGSRDDVRRPFHTRATAARFVRLIFGRVKGAHRAARPAPNQLEPNMKFSHLLLLVAGVPLLASAQTNRSLPAAADAKAPVTPLQYQSVFVDYFSAKDAAQTPDKGWSRANRALLGDQADDAASGGQPTSGTSEAVPKPVPMHGKHEHKGTHQ